MQTTNQQFPLLPRTSSISYIYPPLPSKEQVETLSKRTASCVKTFLVASGFFAGVGGATVFITQDFSLKVPLIAIGCSAIAFCIINCSGGLCLWHHENRMEKMLLASQANQEQLLIQVDELSQTRDELTVKIDKMQKISEASRDEVEKATALGRKNKELIDKVDASMSALGDRVKNCAVSKILEEAAEYLENH